MSRLCNVLGYTRSAYYKKRERRLRSAEHRATVLRQVETVRELEPRTGTRKLHHRIQPRLTAEGVTIGRDKLFELLREEGMLVKRKRRYQRTTYSQHGYAVAPNRVKSLEIIRPNQVLVSDITYIRLKKGFAYLFLVTDAYSRKVLGYQVSRDLSHYSALLALNMALGKISDARGVIHHSDRGSQYCCHEYLEFLQERGMVPSMTDESHCYQNAIAERLNGILKDEFDLDALFFNFEQAKATVERATSIYNNHRTHWSLKLKTPAEVHQEAA